MHVLSRGRIAALAGCKQARPVVVCMWNHTIRWLCSGCRLAGGRCAALAMARTRTFRMPRCVTLYGSMPGCLTLWLWQGANQAIQDAYCLASNLNLIGSRYSSIPGPPSLTHSLARSPTLPLTRALTRSLTHSLAHSPTHSYACSLTLSRLLPQAIRCRYTSLPDPPFRLYRHKHTHTNTLVFSPAPHSPSRTLSCSLTHSPTHSLTHSE